ncbi:STAS domain-containing protein [Hazenella sp. IB182357]|uniref:Anti-sigma factor antagonist n=1 Tax=Polycladospora coralii TaxID=2771432 RepID=A0A926RT34_9BACL|nr:STAS domain-containing protein [Polycladospora coralii]MBD1372300.1 STAS domain-containing protein [Polycladospora coralii]MBS7531510.1 STAS domain-containing protein [Polycladospora coralii]
MNMTVQTKQIEDQGVTIYVEGEVDVYTAPKLRESLMQHCETEDLVRIDLSGVNYIDSTGLGVLIGAYKAQIATEGKLIIIGMNERIKRLFQVTGLDSVIQIEENQEGGQA